MLNMKYCRTENVIAALREWEDDPGTDEHFHQELYELCSRIAADAGHALAYAEPLLKEIERLRSAMVKAEAALADIGDADREPGDDVAWCERRAAQALPEVRAALSVTELLGGVPPNEEIMTDKAVEKLKAKLEVANAALQGAIEKAQSQARTNRELNDLLAENYRLKSAIQRTINENLHLADGDVCTLIHLKRAIAT